MRIYLDMCIYCLPNFLQYPIPNFLEFLTLNNLDVSNFLGFSLCIAHQHLTLMLGFSWLIHNITLFELVSTNFLFGLHKFNLFASLHKHLCPSSILEFPHTLLNPKCMELKGCTLGCISLQLLEYSSYLL
jgi:hypothetical protein